MVQAYRPPDILGSAIRGYTAGTALREAQESRARKRQERLEAGQADFMKQFAAVDPRLPDDQFQQQFDAALDFNYRQHGQDDEDKATFEAILMMDPQQKRAFVNQAMTSIGVKPPTEEEYTLTPGAARFRGREQIAAVPAKPVAEKVAPTSQLEKLISEQAKYPEGSREWDIYERRITKETATGGETIRSLPGGGFEIIRGGKPMKASEDLPKPVIKDIAKSIVNNESNLSKLERIGEQYIPSFLTYGGKIKSALSGIKSKAGADLSPEEIKFVGDRRKFIQNINQLFNAYRKEITGAAASVQELESLKKAMLSEDLSPVEFQAAYDEFRSELRRANRLNRRILREGIKGDYGKNFDNLFTAGEDDDPELRGQELMEQEGLSFEEATRRLAEEGY